MSASSPGPDDKSGITEIVLSGDRFYAQRTVSTITVFDEEWGELFAQANSGQSNSAVAQAIDAFQVGRKRGRNEGRAIYRMKLLDLLGAQPAKEEG
jgi:hypothetical protein